MDTDRIIGGIPSGRMADTSRLDPSDAKELWSGIDSLIDGNLASFSPDECVDLALEVRDIVPAHLLRRVVDFRRRAPLGDVLLLRGMVPDDVEFPPTVTESSALPIARPTQIATMLLLGVAVVFGEPFNYASLWGGRIVPNLIPVPGKEHLQTSQSSQGSLDWHVEDGYREDRCDYASLLCLRGDPEALTRLAQTRDLDLPADLATTLRQERFMLKPDPAHVLPEHMPMRRVAVLSGSETEPEIIYDTHHITPIDTTDTEAAAALTSLHLLLDKVHIAHPMTKGDLLVLDNRRVVHSRAPFNARYDGTDRWLLRAMICGSAAQFRRWPGRITK